MPIFKFLAVTGAALVALLFVADATLTPSEPQFTNESEGLTRPQPKQKVAKLPEPVQPQEAPRPRAPSLLQVDAANTEPVQDETVRYELPQPVIAAPAPIAALTPTLAPALAPPAAATETAALAPATAVDAAASAALAKAEGRIEAPKTEAPKIEAAKVEPARIEPSRSQTAATEPARVKPAKVEAAKMEPVRTETAKSEPIKSEAIKPRAPALVQVAPPQPAIAAPAPVVVSTPAPATAQTAVTAAPQVRTETPKTEAVKTEPASAAIARIKAAMIEATRAEAAQPAVTKPAATKFEATKTETSRVAPAPKPRKLVARTQDRSGRYAAYRDAPYVRDHRGPVENGYAYGVNPAEARAERRQWSGGDFGQNYGRF
jgi:hypothetical protein